MEMTIGVIERTNGKAGIAHVAALSGYNVVLTDISEERLATGVAVIVGKYESISVVWKKLSKGQISRGTRRTGRQNKIQIEDALARITTSVDSSVLSKMLNSL